MHAAQDKSWWLAASGWCFETPPNNLGFRSPRSRDSLRVSMR